MTERQEKIIEQIKDRLLKNAIAEYNGNLDMCGSLYYAARHKKEFEKESQKLFEERVYLMQDYNDVIYDPDYKEDELNFNYKDDEQTANKEGI